MIPPHVPLRSTFHPAACLPNRNPALADEILGDLKDMLGRPRLASNGSVPCSSPADLTRLFGSAEAVGLDLEWDPEDPARITMIAVSDGHTTAMVDGVACLAAWLGRVSS